MITFRAHVPLKPFSNYKIGGISRFFCEVRTVAQLAQAIRKAKHEKLKVFVLGGGTNLLIHDKGFDGLVVKPAFSVLRRNGNCVRAGAGVSMNDLLTYSASLGLAGLEWAGGLPGTFGGAIRGNAGAFGGEIKDAIVSVKSFDMKTGTVITRDRRACRFAYRTSVFKKKQGCEIILEATCGLKKGDQDKIMQAIEEKIAYRFARHPMDYPNIGSIFKNVPLENVPKRHQSLMVQVVKTDPIPVVPTAYLISECGLRGVSLGGAMISPKHPNFIVNVCEARAEDVHTLILLAKSKVKERFGVDLELEVEIVG